MGQRKGIGLRCDGKAYQPTASEEQDKVATDQGDNTTRSKKPCLMGCVAVPSSSRITWGPQRVTATFISQHGRML